MSMIRINLLPVRQVKKRELGLQTLVLFGIVVVAALLGNWLWASSRSDELAGLDRRVADTRREIAELEKVIGEVSDINTRKKEVEDKLAILDKLREGRTGPVRMLDALAHATPKKVWLQNFSGSGANLNITGQAISHDDVAELMRSLANVVWTPRGIGRVLEQRRNAKTTRVELMGNGAVQELPVAEVSPFFRGVNLKKASQTSQDGRKRVDFEISMNAS